MMDVIITGRYLSPAGEMILGSSGDRLCVCDWVDSKRRETNARRIRRHLKAEYKSASSDVINQAITQLDEYFTGQRQAFSVPLLLTGTPFQRSVWTALLTIPYGVTVTYGELSRRIANPMAVRAVAQAVAGNPLSILVPCHRVIGSDGTLTGYAGGLPAKRLLLALESHPLRH